MLHEGFFDRNKPYHIRWGDLPHLRQEGGLYFVTFRLGDSLPEAKLGELRDERDRIRQLRESGDEPGALRMSRRYRRQLERWLDKGSGSCVLRERKASEIVKGAIRYFEGKRYELGRFAVAPNHVHALLRTASEIDLSDVLYSWKRFSSRELRKIPKIRERFAAQKHLWQVETFDHIVRNQIELDRIDAYIASHEN